MQQDKPGAGVRQPIYRLLLRLCLRSGSPPPRPPAILTAFQDSVVAIAQGVGFRLLMLLIEFSESFRMIL